MWSNLSIPGSPELLMIDATLNSKGWESTFFRNLYTALMRSELKMAGSAPVQIKQVTEFVSYCENPDFNCLLLFAHDDPDTFGLELKLSTLLDSLRGSTSLPQLLLAICCIAPDPLTSEVALKSLPSVAPIVTSAVSSVTQRELGLFYLKFFTELRLHSKDQITGKMAWFSCSKAKELLRRRRYPGKFGIRC